MRVRRKRAGAHAEERSIGDSRLPHSNQSQNVRQQDLNRGVAEGPPVYGLCQSGAPERCGKLAV